jgi:hypothetical protein
MADLRVLKTPTSGRIVAELERLLAEAKAGNVTGLFVFSEDLQGNVTHSRDGMPDATILFWLQLVQRRILEAYG